MTEEEIKEQDEKVKAFRALYKEFVSCYQALPIYDALSQLMSVGGVIESEYRELQNKMKVKDLKIKKINGVKVDDKMKYVLSVLEDLTISEAMTYASQLANAIEVEKYKKTKEWTVESLNLELL